MTMAMLSVYPELFAAGAVIAGLPFGVAQNVRDALLQMRMPSPRDGRELGNLVRRASSFRGHWPRLSVWHGTADRTVHPDNADEIVKQWLDLHRLPLGPMAETDVDGYPHQVWWNGDGETMVESYTVTDMAHGTPLGVAENDKRYGKQGPFLIDAGISSSYHIAKVFRRHRLDPAAQASRGIAEREAHSPGVADLIGAAEPVQDAAAEIGGDEAGRCQFSGYKGSRC
jgi:poly(3-hydroxybutyrate) depolymerase